MKTSAHIWQLCSIGLLLLMCCKPAAAQGEVFYFENPSFEVGMPLPSYAPPGWISLGEMIDSPVDVQPGFWEVNLKAQHGKQYVGMVVRENGTREGIGQPIGGFLQKDSSYTFSAWLTRSGKYLSSSLRSPDKVALLGPVVLEIWGYNTRSEQYELFDVTKPIENIDSWGRFNFYLNPQLGDYDEIDLMLNYVNDYEYENGNLLIDNCSAIVKMK